MTKLLIVKASARSQSTGTNAVAWIEKTLQRVNPQAQYEVVDLATFTLPFAAEPYMPATGNYVNENTKLWSQKVSEADVVVFVTPEYNLSYPGSLKNAIDHLKNEWVGKKAAIIAYSPSGAYGVMTHLHDLLNYLGVVTVGRLAVGTFLMGFDGQTGYTASFDKAGELGVQGALDHLLATISK